MTKREWAEEQVDEAVFIDGYDEAIVGTTEDGRVVYDYYQMLECLDMDADEFIQYNTIRALAYLEKPPVIMYPVEE